MLLKNIRSLKHAVLLLCHLKPSAQCWCVSLRKNSREFGVFMLFHIYRELDDPFQIEPDPITIVCQKNEPRSYHDRFPEKWARSDREISRFDLAHFRSFLKKSQNLLCLLLKTAKINFSTNTHMYYRLIHDIRSI